MDAIDLADLSYDELEELRALLKKWVRSKAEMRNREDADGISKLLAFAGAIDEELKRRAIPVLKT